jgi:hypothetical protein
VLVVPWSTAATKSGMSILPFAQAARWFWGAWRLPCVAAPDYGTVAPPAWVSDVRVSGAGQFIRLPGSSLRMFWHPER